MKLFPSIVAAKNAWEMEKKADKSFIRETFYGQQRSTLRCSVCGWESVTYESFFELPLKLPNGNKRCSLRQLVSFMKVLSARGGLFNTSPKVK